MWFAALDDPQRIPWFSRFLERLLENEPSVTCLRKRILSPTNRRLMCARSFTNTRMLEVTMRPASGGSGAWLGLYFPKARLRTQAE